MIAIRNTRAAALAAVAAVVLTFAVLAVICWRLP